MNTCASKAVFLSLILLGGCGYHLSGQSSFIPDDIKKIAIPLFSNMTLRPDIENQFTNIMIEEFAKGRRAVIVDEGAADAVIHGIIRSFESVPVSFDSTDSIKEFRATVTLDVSMVRKSKGEVLWNNKNISYFSEYRNNPSVAEVEANKDAAIRKIALETARLLYSNILEGF